jgi:hypothetical protein
MKKIILIILLAAIAAAAYFIFKNEALAPDGKQNPVQITSFEECAAKYPVMESYPRQCNTPDGKHFVENIGNANEVADLIVAESPRPNAIVKSPLTISGRARGTWYFEASFPVRIIDANGKQLAIAPAAAQGEWMTEEFVPFSVVLEFKTPQTATGTLILEKDNPSGLPENANQLEIPVKF